MLRIRRHRFETLSKRFFGAKVRIVDGVINCPNGFGEVLRAEIQLARQLHQIQSRDSRIGFEATNHYYYIPQDLLEKILNCEHLLTQLT